MASDGEISCANDPNFAVIYSFLKVFGKLYGIEVPSLAKLQEYIENTQEVLEPLKELHLRLLRRALKSVLSTRWEKGLIKFCHQQGHHQEAWEIERFSYKKASTQVKLKVLKLLLEYQFTCHPKFKTAVNALSCKELRLNPIGKDKNGCVYWLEVDNDANICLFKEDQDEETWQLVARNREEFVKVIEQLKTGEEVCPLNTSNANEDSSSAEINPKEPGKSEIDEDNEEEFLSPESESDHESEEKQEVVSEQDEKTIDEEQHQVENENTKANSSDFCETSDDPKVGFESSKQEAVTKSLEDTEDIKEVSEEIEEPVMIITGEGNGVDCDSSYIGEEIIEDVMFFYGEGYGYDNDTGNPEVIEQSNSPEHHSDEENTNDECLNGEHELNPSNKNKIGKGIKLKNSLPVNKRALKKQSNVAIEVLKPETKKHCIRELEKSDSSNSVPKNSDDELSKEVNSYEKITANSENLGNNHIKKGRRKVKKKFGTARQLKVKEKEIINFISETDNGNDSKTNIIEKRKSSVSSEEQEDISRSDNDKEKSPDKELKVEDPLPPKKLRLETTPDSDVNTTHSKAKLADSLEQNDSDSILNDPISERKKIKASKGKFKRKNIANSSDNKCNKDKSKDSGKRNSKSLKRSLLDATMSDKNKSESQSDSEEDEPVASGKRLKIKPKKIIKSARKKVEAKLKEKQSSDESDDETLYSLAGRKTSKRLVKKKSKNAKHKTEQDNKSEADDILTPVRTSRRIALMKIKEQGKTNEDNAHETESISKNKKKAKEEEEWRESGASSSDGKQTIALERRRQRAWRGSASSGPEPDSESDEPLFELPLEEPELNFDQSDHEFSPESDLESGEPAEPLRRARTLQEEKDEGFCKRCGSGEQPEWILLCDSCDTGYHASCLKPMLFQIPEGDWFCPQCNHDRLIESLEKELVKYDELVELVKEEKARRQEEEPEPEAEEKKVNDNKAAKEKSDSEESGSSGWSSSSSEGAVYRLRTRKQLPVSYRAREYDRLISTAIKEEYVEPTTSAGNQGRGKDISTIIEAAEEEKQKAIEREAIEQGKPLEAKKVKRKQRRKPRKLNSLDVPSEDDDETDEDFKDTGLESSSEDISSSADRESTNDSGSTDSLPVRRKCRSEKKERPTMAESSPEVKKKKKGIFDDSSSESAGAKEWSAEKKYKKVKVRHKRRDGSKKKKKKKRQRTGLTQYDAQGNVIRARVTYGGLSDEEGPNDWSPKHRTRQKKIDYTEMPNTESEEEMHKSSGKHMPDSSDEFKVSESELSSGSDADRKRPGPGADDANVTAEERQKALSDLIRKTAVVPLEKLPEDVARAKTEELHAHLNAQAQETVTINSRPLRGRGGRGSRGFRGGRGRRGRGGSAPFASAGEGSAADPPTDDALAKLVGVKIKDLTRDTTTPLRQNQVEREKKRLEREAKQAEKEARKLERLQKKEEKEKLKEQKAKEREEKRLAKLALQESKRVKKEKPEFQQMGAGYGMQPRMNMYGNAPIPIRHPPDYHEQRFPATPRLQVRAELRRADAPPDALRDGTLSVAGSPQPFKPVSEEPSIITRMPHMIGQQYRGPMMYGGNSPAYGPRPPQNVMYPQQLAARAHYPGYYPPPYAPASPGPPPHYRGPGAQYGPRAPVRPPPGAPSPESPAYRAQPPGQYGPRVPVRPPTGAPSPEAPAYRAQPPVGQYGPRVPGMPPGAQSPESPAYRPQAPIGQYGPRGAPSPESPAYRPQAPVGQYGPRGAPSPESPAYRPQAPVVQYGPRGAPSPESPAYRPQPPLGQFGPRGAPSPESSAYRPQPPIGQYGPRAGPTSELPAYRALPPVGQYGPRAPGMHARPPPGASSLEPPAYRAQPPLGQYGPRAPGLPLEAPSPESRAPPPAGPPRPTMAPPPAVTTPSPVPSPPIQIKAEVKTEPEYRSPVSSPAPPSPPEPPRHPKIKHVENKDRRPRHPLGPYAPHYGPYGPYAPGSGPPPERPRPPYGPPPYHLQRPPFPQYSPAERPRSPAQRPSASAPERISTTAPSDSYIPVHLRAPGPAPERPPPATQPEPFIPTHVRPSGPAPERAQTTAQSEPFTPTHLRPSAPTSERPPATTCEPFIPAHTRPPGPGPERSPAAGPPDPFVPSHLRPPARQQSPHGPGGPLAEAGRAPPRGFTAHAVQRLVGEPTAAEPAGDGPGPAREEGSVFGGLVSYFSSQHEDDIDA